MHFPAFWRRVASGTSSEGASSAQRFSAFAPCLALSRLQPWLGRARILLVSTIAHSGRWNLPSGKLLETTLSSCQIEHVSRGGITTEHMICPTRLAAHDFPKVLKDAVIASEDERFFSHGALEMRSTVRAAWHYFLGNRQGGSTLTQQLARTMFLKKEDSLERKLLEAVLAVRISALLSRQDIFTRYMNVVPHARNMYGFDDPARYLFRGARSGPDVRRGGASRRHAPGAQQSRSQENPGAALEGRTRRDRSDARAEQDHGGCGGRGEGGTQTPPCWRQAAARRRLLCTIGISALSRPRA